MKNKQAGKFENDKGDVMVSICCLTYNHQKYIRKALEGFLMQKTGFSIELIVHDDASTDGTREIIVEYIEKHPDLFQAVFQPKNLYSSGTGIYQIYTKHVFPRARGKYIAICEGDDYWTDPLKLQKQIDFLEKNDDYAICIHNAGFESNLPAGIVEHENFYGEFLKQETEFGLKDIIRNNFIPNCTTVYRNTIKTFPHHFNDCSFPDWPIHIIYAETGKIKYLDELMAVHFIHENGMWEGSGIETKARAVYHFYISLIRYAKPVLYPAILEAINIHPNNQKEVVFSEVFNLAYTLGAEHEKERTNELQNVLNLIFQSQSWKLANLMRIGSALVFPPDSFRRRLGKSAYHFLKKVINGAEILRQKIRGRLMKLGKALRKFKTIKITNAQWPAGKPLVSVIIPNFNYGNYISQTIASVLDQTFKNFEVIVVDGGSTDPETIRVLNDVKHPKIQVHFRGGRYLVGNNRNYGINVAKGKYICCIDSDDMIEPTYLEKALYFLESKNYDVVYPWVISFGNSNSLWKTSTLSFEEMVSQSNPVATVAVFRKDAWKKIGGYKDWPIGAGHIPEDWEFWVRMAGHGFLFKHIPEPLMLYRRHESSLTSLCETSHEKQLEVIRFENQRLFDKKFKRIRNKNSRRTFVVENPYINLIQAKSRKRILIALPFMIIGGVDTLFLNIFSNIAKIYDISIITSIDTPEEYGDNTLHYKKITKEIYKLNKFLSIDGHAEDFIKYLVEAKQIDLILIAGSEVTYPCLPEIKSKFSHLKITDFLFNEIDHIQNNRKYSGYIDMNIVENEKIQSLLIEKYDEKSEKIQVIHNGVNLNQPLNNFDRSATIAKHCLNEQKFLVAYLGRFSKEKNPFAVIEIAKTLRNQPVEFIMGGHGPVFSEVVQEIQVNLLQDTIKTPGFVNSMEILSLAGVLILPSTLDGRPNIVLEAMAMGVPVIASNIGGLPGIIKHGETGFLLDADDLEGFAQTILKLKNDPELRESIGKAARQYAEEVLNDTFMHKKWEQVLEEMIGKIE